MSDPLLDKLESAVAELYKSGDSLAFLAATQEATIGAQKRRIDGLIEDKWRLELAAEARDDQTIGEDLRALWRKVRARVVARFAEGWIR